METMEQKATKKKYNISECKNFVNSIPNKVLFEIILNTRIENTLRLKSIYKKERTPSMFIFYYEKLGDYYFKDFSSDKFGGPVTLYKDIKGVSTEQAYIDLYEKVNEYIKNGNKIDTSYHPTQSNKIINEYDDTYIKDKYKIDYYFDDFNEVELRYFEKGNISRDILNKFGVISSYYMKYKDGKTFIRRMFCYTTPDGKPIQFYLPKAENISDKKVFISTMIFNDWIYGYDNINTNNNILVICSSLKDMMSLYSVCDDDINIISFGTETFCHKTNKLLNLDLYKIFVLYDNDEEGNKKALKLKNEFPFVNILKWELEKDIFDAVCRYGKDIVKNHFYKLIKEYKYENKNC